MVNYFISCYSYSYKFVFIFSLAVSHVNSLATVTWEDFLYRIPAFQKTADGKQLLAIKVIGVCYAITNLIFVIIAALMPSVIDCSYLATSATAGPLMGVFITAMLIPFINGKGAVAGMVLSYAVICSLIAGSFVNKIPRTDLLPTTIEVILFFGRERIFILFFTIENRDAPIQHFRHGSLKILMTLPLAWNWKRIFILWLKQTGKTLNLI